MITCDDCFRDENGFIDSFIGHLPKGNKWVHIISKLKFNFYNN